jgi:PAS domain S-box-containing protein
MQTSPLAHADPARDAVVTRRRSDDASGPRATIEQLQAQALRYQVALDSISPGVAFFDAEERLVLCSRRYAEIYRLDCDRLTPGVTLREVIELRVAAGTCPLTVDDYLSFTRSITSRKAAHAWSITLDDGRSIAIRHQPSLDGGWVSTHEDVTDLRERRLLIEERLSLQSLIDLVPDNLWVKDAFSYFVVANLATAQRMGYATPRELIGKSDLELCPWETAQKYLADEEGVLTTGRPMIDREEYVLTPNDGKLWISTTKVPLRDEKGEIVGIIGVSRDVSARRRADTLREGEAEILEMIATGAPVESVLDSLVHLIESQSPGIFGSVLLISDDGAGLRHCVAPSLPAEYAEVVDGLPIGPDVACSGSGAYRRELVAAADIASDPRWANYRDPAAKLGFRSCWSAPIVSKGGDVLGVFAFYSTTAHDPTEDELRLVHRATRLAGIAIERQRVERLRP